MCLWPAGVAPIQPLAWEPPYAVSVALKRKKKKKRKGLHGFECVVDAQERDECWPRVAAVSPARGRLPECEFQPHIYWPCDSDKLCSLCL